MQSDLNLNNHLMKRMMMEKAFQHSESLPRHYLQTRKLQLIDHNVFNKDKRCLMRTEK